MHIKFTIEGISPLLLNRFHEAAQAAVSSGSRTVLTGQKPLPREQAEQKLYRDSNERCVLPAQNLLAAIVDAGKHIKSGKSKLTTMKGSLIPAGIGLLEFEMPIAPGKWEVDSRAVVIPSTGGRMMCHRPRFDEWRISSTLLVDESMFDKQLVRELLDLAGSRVGIGDFRPARRGPFGRFKVVTWAPERV